MFAKLTQKLFCLMGAAAMLMPSAAHSQVTEQNDARLIVGVPAYVWHPKDRPGAADWNDGWFENEGVFADLTWPVYTLSENTNLRAGFAAGGFDNSIFKTSFFAGGAAEIESFVTDRISANIGIYAGGITGYENDFGPAVAPYIGSAYKISDEYEMGVRGIWLPAETIAGSDLAPSDAYIAAVTIGRRF